MKWVRLAAAAALLFAAARPARADIVIDGVVGDVESDRDEGGSTEIHLSNPSMRSFVKGVAGASQNSKITLSGDEMTIVSKGKISSVADTDVSASFEVSFSVAVASRMKAKGAIQRATASTANVSALYSNHRLLLDGTDSVDTKTADEEFDLPPGSYAVDFHVAGTETTASWDFTIEVCPGKCDPTWKTARNGSFSDASNWKPARVPIDDATFDDRAVFDADGAYTVTVGTQTTVGLTVRRGSPRLVSGDYSVHEPTGQEAISVRGGAKLTLGPSMTLGALSAGVSGDAAADETASLVVSGGGAGLTVEDLYVGGSSGAGRLSVVQGSVAADALYLAGEGPLDRHVYGELEAFGPTGELHCGLLSAQGAFYLDVCDGGLVECGEARLFATNPGDYGFVGLGRFRSPALLPSVWRMQSLESTADAAATLRLQVLAGGVLDVTGAADVRGLELSSDRGGGAVRPRLHVGGAFDMTATRIEHFDSDVTCDGAVAMPRSLRLTNTLWTLSASAAPVDVVVGGGPPDGVGFVDVRAGSVLDSRTPGRDWFIGATPGAAAEMLVGRSGEAGALFSSRGDVELGNADGSGVAGLGVAGGSRFTCTGTLTVHPGSSVSGVMGRTTTIVQPKKAGRSTARAPAAVQCGEFVNHGAVVAEGLRVEGDFTQGADGVTVVEVGGADVGTSDLFVVTGAARLDGKLVLQFENGFAPKAGEAVDVAAGGSGSSGTFAEVEVRGLAPGADFQVAVVDGLVKATPNSDTVALPTVSVKVNARKLAEKRTKKVGLFTFTRTGARTAALEVAYAVSGTATSGADYAAFSGTVTIPAGAKSAAVVVTLVNDATPERVETVEVRVLPGPGHTRGKVSRAALSIVDDDRLRR